MGRHPIYPLGRKRQILLCQILFVPDPLPEHPPNRRWDYQRAIEYLYGRIDYERDTSGQNDHTFRLERTRDLFEKLGLGDYLDRPHCDSAVDGPFRGPSGKSPKVPLIHIAGTKGKGSTAAMVGEILTAAGYRVGMYTSPHLTDLEERFRIDGIPCSHSELIELVETVAPVVDRFDATESPVSFFELTTAMAVLYFDRNACDAMILEVGLGGRLDSTNVCASTVAAITSIGLDHQRVLGHTLGEIAYEKAGIIKSGVPVVSGVTQPQAAAVIRRTAARAGSQMFEIGIAFTVRDRRDAAVGSEFVYCPAAGQWSPSMATDELTISLSLDGAHQVHNAAVAISIVRQLADPGSADPLPVSESQIALGLSRVRCSGRLERFQLEASSDDSPPTQIIIDTAHNHDSTVALCDAILVRTVGGGEPQSGLDAKSSDAIGQIRRPIIAVFGTSRDKDASSMAAELSKLADQVICTRFTTNPRSVPIDQLTEAFDQQRSTQPALNIQRQSDPHLALIEAIQAASPGGTVVVCGSFFLAGQLRPDVLAMPNLRSQGKLSSVDSLARDGEQPVRQNASVDEAVTNSRVETR